MSDAEQLPDNQDVDLDDHAHQACYVFKPSTADLNERPNKRRKTTHISHQTDNTLPLLCNGTETKECARIRYETFCKSWNQQQVRIDEAITQLDNDALQSIMKFVKEAGQHNREGKLKAGLVVSGSDTSVQARLLNQWRTARLASTEIVSELRSSSCPNLQTALKNIIKSTITEAIGQDGYLDFFAKHKRLIPMNFDLELLQILVGEQNISKVVISILDVETFETNMLSELISTLSSWSGRIPFVALLGIATTVELFELRLPKSITSLLEAGVFTLSSPTNILNNILSSLQTASDSSLFFGPTAVSMLHDLAQNQSTTIEGFTKMLKCAYMSHFFANPLSVLLSNVDIETPDAGVLCEAIRNTESFQNYCETLLTQGKSSLSSIRDLLDHDAKLIDAARSAIVSGQDEYRSALETLAAIIDLRQRVKTGGNELVFQADPKFYNHLDDLATSEVFEGTISDLENLTSSELLESIIAMSTTTRDILGIGQVVDEIQQLHEREGLQSIRSLHDTNVPLSSVATTISPSKKKTLASKKAPTKLTQAEQEYVSIVDSLIQTMTNNIRAHTFSYSNTFLHEAFIYNSRQPLQNTFTPRPRFALERALHKPSDYLGCECCSSHAPLHNQDDPDNTKNPHPPPPSLLYNLLQEAGTIINVRDLFDAFSSRLFPVSSSLPPPPIMTPDDTNTEEESENQDQDRDRDQRQKQEQRLTLALFYCSLSELKALGMVKGSTSAVTKKRALVSNGGDGEKGRKGYADIDFVAKTSWAGL